MHSSCLTSRKYHICRRESDKAVFEQENPDTFVNMYQFLAAEDLIRQPQKRSWTYWNKPFVSIAPADRSRP